MNWIANIEEFTASKLKEVFIDTKALLDEADAEVNKLETQLAAARQKAADLAARVQVAAETAAAKAEAEFLALKALAEAAAEKAFQRASVIPAPVDPTPAPVDPTPATS